MDTANWPVYGHDWAVQHLRKALLNGRVRHAYLIVGTAGIGRLTLARAFAMALNCTHADEAQRPCGQCRSCKLIAGGSHADVIYSETDASTGTLRIEELRSVMGKLALKPYEARYRIAIFPDFERARPQAQDALLKTLEEPPPHALLLLIASSTEALLPTITSRSQTLHLRPVAAETIREVLITHKGAAPEQADLLAGLSGGRLGWAIQALEDPAHLEQRAAALSLLDDLLRQNRHKRFELAEDLSKDKLRLFPLLELWQTYWRDVLLLSEGAQIPPANRDRLDALEQLAGQLEEGEALHALQATRDTLAKLNTNLNVRLALEVLFLDYPGLVRR
jgi:DNA polymerase-3 subunit delta'